MSNILNFLFPPRCPACRRIMEDETELIHNECRKAFRIIKEPRCFKCGRHMADPEETICPDCKKKGHGYSYGFAVFEYNDTAQKAMIDYKKNGWRKNGDFFAAEAVKNFGRQIKNMKPEVLIPVPVTDKKLKRRGFNQSEYLAERIGESLDIPVDAGILIRRSGKAQKELSRQERTVNALSAFECMHETEYKRVCIIDDVYTTGSTIEGCSRALMSAGVKETGFIVIFSSDLF